MSAKFRIIRLAAALLCMALPAQGAVISAASAGLAGADVNLTFSEVAIANNALVTNQFAGFGVTFSNGVRKNPQLGNFPNISGVRLGNFAPIVGAFSINFLNIVTDASFAMVTNAGISTFSARLNGIVVQSFTASTNIGSLANFFGFSGLQFNEIRVTPGGVNSAMLMDNLAFNIYVPPAAVPIPAAGLMLLSVLGALTIIGRRKSGAALG